MAFHHAASGEVVDVRPSGIGAGGQRSRALIRAEGLEVMRLVVRQGDSIPPHAGHDAPLTIHCLQGRVRLEAHGTTRDLAQGELVYLAPGVRHGLLGLSDAVLLVTLALPRRDAALPVGEGGGN